MKSALLCMALILAPALAFAQECSSEQPAITCAAGTVYDAATKSCVPQTS